MVSIGTILGVGSFGKSKTTLRPFSFVFYTLETIFNMFCMAFHIKGFMAVDLKMLTWDRHVFQYIYMVTFYVFMVITLFQSINICSGHSPGIVMEIFKSCFAAVGFTTIAVLTMWDAERDFHLMYSGKEPVEGVFMEDKPVHPFAAFLLFQSIASLACGVLYMLHTTILIDIKMTSHIILAEGNKSIYTPIEIYVLGDYIQGKLEKYKWFHKFCSLDRIDI